MNRWLKVQFSNENEGYSFVRTINGCIAESYDTIFYKIFTTKAKDTKYKLFFIADEGSSIIKCLESKFPVVHCSTPQRNLLSRIAGFSRDRDWMLS